MNARRLLAVTKRSVDLNFNNAANGPLMSSRCDDKSGLASRETLPAIYRWHALLLLYYKSEEIGKLSGCRGGSSSERTNEIMATETGEEGPWYLSRGIESERLEPPTLVHLLHVRM